MDNPMIKNIDLTPEMEAMDLAEILQKRLNRDTDEKLNQSASSMQSTAYKRVKTSI